MQWYVLYNVKIAREHGWGCVSTTDVHSSIFASSRMLVMMLAAVLISTESVRSALEGTFAWGVQLLVDHTQEFFWGLLLLTCFCLLSYIMEPEKPKPSHADKPRWELFRLSNYFVIAIFVVSLSILLSHDNRLDHRAPKHNPLILYASAGACMLALTYFFAFFAVSFVSNQVQDEASSEDEKWPEKVKPCQPVLQSTPMPLVNAEDAAILEKLTSKNPKTGRPLMALHELEKQLGDMERAVHLRRQYFQSQSQLDFTNLPLEGYDYTKIYGSNCEVVVGYVPLPVGLAGPIQVNGENIYLPMATTEGCLIASTNRGCKVLSMGSGVQSIILADGITRAPCVRFPRARDAAILKAYLDNSDNFAPIAAAFNSTTRYGRLVSLKTIQSGRNCYIRIVCNAGNAMGMNMVSKGTLAVLTHLKELFPDMELVAISGNVCTDKKSAAINWIDGRGKSVVADAVVKADIVERVLHTTVDKLVDLNLQKNLVGSAMAGALGGFNAHAANILTAIFLATGQDPAQNVESSSCMTMMEKTAEGDLYMSVTMPSIEVGTVGGGTHLAAQHACLGLMGCTNTSEDSAKEQGARRLACAIAAGVMAAFHRIQLHERLSVCVPNKERCWGTDISSIPKALREYFNRLHTLGEDKECQEWTWSIVARVNQSWKCFERGMVSLCLGFFAALEAEQLENTSVDECKELWRKAAGYLNYALDLLQGTDIHASHQIQLPRSSLGQQLRWIVSAYKIMCRATYLQNEAQLYMEKPQIALVFCEAVLKTKLPIPPQYSHRTCAIFTKIMQELVVAHQILLKATLEEKSQLQDCSESTLPQGALERFLAVEPLVLSCLQPISPTFDIEMEATEINHQDNNDDNEVEEVEEEQPQIIQKTPSRDMRIAKYAHRLGMLPPKQPAKWSYGIEPSTTYVASECILRGTASESRLTPRHHLSTNSLPSPMQDDELFSEFKCPPRHSVASVFKRKNCGLCERSFPVANLTGQVVMRRILDLRIFWGVESEKNPKYAAASFLYHNVRICVLCTEILSGAPTAIAGHSAATVSNATIKHHVSRLRKQSLTLHSIHNQLDEIGLMIHQSILNDALLLKTPLQIHRRIDVTRRKGVKASQSSCLLLGVASNAIDPLSNRGIHTQEEQSPWWEVDLGTHCTVRSIEIWNRVDSDPGVAARLFPCHIILSMKPGGRRDLDTLIALCVDSTIITQVVQPVRWEPKASCIARYVRICANRWTYLHLERVHVFGVPLQQDEGPKTRPSTSKPKSSPIRFQQERFVGELRPKSAGFLTPTVSSSRRSQIGKEIRSSIDAQ
ncbi:hypothetical protein THRCLA_05269 [Thraustotheca clavata]|uniref:hydroxymethylglutaryl-CoA reductase (NADPH) n=1 Tax=Thraustotheca clavata TaxID=74557 RepID=A0A1V9ZWF4_9STRA|nr:hypothetical protein THRCLA_05269 [Thraustotheca clavata]